MNTKNKLAAFTLVLSLLATPSLFADNRRHDATDGWRGRSHQSQRITVEGRVRDIDRDRNEIVIRLDRGGYTLVAERDEIRGLRRLERGDLIRATGYANRGTLRVSDIDVLRSEDHRGGRDDRYLSGVVTNVDRRAEVIWMSVDRTGRVVAVDARRRDVNNLRRGDRITVRGDWQRNGRFEAERIEVDRGSRW